MALNYSHRPIFPAHISEDNLVAPMRIVNGYVGEGIPEKHGDGFGRSCHVNREVDECFKYGGNRVDRCGTPESVSKDIVDLLPSDPFGMNISTTFTAAITGWLEDLELDYGGYARSGVEGSREDYGLFAGLNLIWNNAMRFQSFSEGMLFDNKPNTVCLMDGYSEEGKSGDSSSKHDFGSVHNSVVVLDLDNGSTGVFPQKIEESPEATEFCSAGDGGDPHEALFFALSYLEVHDLLSVERVCRSLRFTVQNDPLLWRSIHINQPLNEKITDDVLLQLTGRAQGSLQSLSLVECPRITDDGLRRVLETNPRLTKLCVPGCTRLSVEGIVNSMKAFKSNRGTQGIKRLRIGGLYGVTREHFEELKLLLGLDGQSQQIGQKPLFYHRGNFYLLCDDERALDIEICPRCQKSRLVYDCPAQSCQAKDDTTQVCRACTLCIARCVQCGQCISDGEYEETFCLELLCSDCFKLLLKGQESQDKKVCPIKDAFGHQPNYELCFRG